MTLQENGRALPGPRTTSKVAREGGRRCSQGEAERRRKTLLLSDLNKMNLPLNSHHEPRAASSFSISSPFEDGKAGPLPKGKGK